jgi:hypothetical protein
MGGIGRQKRWNLVAIEFSSAAALRSLAAARF